MYKDGNEPGAIVGVIQYPRFPLEHDKLRERTVELAKQLLVELKQLRVSIVLPNVTILLEKEDED